MTEGVIRGILPPDCNPQRVAKARKTVRWTVFTEQRAGRPWTMYAARSIFAEQNMPLEEKTPFTSAGAKMRTLRICRPGALKGREANPSGGSVGGSQDPHAVTVQFLTEQLRKNLCHYCVIA